MGWPASPSAQHPCGTLSGQREPTRELTAKPGPPWLICGPPIRGLASFSRELAPRPAAGDVLRNLAVPARWLRMSSVRGCTGDSGSRRPRM